jgi:predicted MPP superfamily phosphohydrolase
VGVGASARKGPLCHGGRAVGYAGIVLHRRRRPYGPRHLFLEKLLSIAYSGGWPARLWRRVPGATRVDLLAYDVDLGRGPERPPLRLAFASDLHLGPTTPPEVLDNAFRLLEDAAPDVLLLGGDYVFLGATPERVRELNDRVSQVPAALKVAVLVNHDFWARPARLETALGAAGMVVLVDEGYRLPPPHDDIALVGLDDPYTSKDIEDRVARQRSVDAALARVDDAPLRIAVCHAPDGLNWVLGRRVQLLLCGHTHGGHLALPGGRPLWMPSPVGKRYPHGLHQVDGTALFVSRGVGGSLVPMRTFARPDVAVFTVR